MIIYKDIITGDELLSDTYKIIDVGDGLWEVDLRKITKGSDNFVLEAAIPSAEGVDAEEGGDDSAKAEQVLDLEDQFRLELISQDLKPDVKKEVRDYVKRLNKALQAKEDGESKAEEFRSLAPAAVKKLTKNAGAYDVLRGESLDDAGMWVLVDYREDGITPYATFWKHGLEPMKV